MATVYRFRTWEIATDTFRTSQRWATMEAIERAGGEPITNGVEIDDNYLGHEVDGMTARGFDPANPPTNEFRSRVR